jgi:hypothetical protein
MSFYRAYFYDLPCTITGAASVDGACDEDAIAKAAALLRERADSFDFELWFGDRPVRILPRTKDGELQRAS